MELKTETSKLNTTINPMIIDANIRPIKNIDQSISCRRLKELRLKVLNFIIIMLFMESQKNI